MPDAIASWYAYLENASRLSLDAREPPASATRSSPPKLLEVRNRSIAAEWLTLSVL